MDKEIISLGELQEEDKINIPGQKTEPPIVEPVVEPIVPIPPVEEKPEVAPEPNKEVLGSDDDLPKEFSKPVEQPKTPEQIEEETKEAEEEARKQAELDDPFKMELPEDKLGKDKPSELPTFNFSEIAKEFDVELKENNLESFKSAINEKLESVKQTVQVDLTKFNEKEKLVVDWLHRGGKLEDFFKPLLAYDNFLIQPDDEKVKDYLITEEGIAEDNVDERLNQIIDEGEFDAYVDKVDESVLELRNQKYEQILETARRTTEAYEQQVAQNRVKEQNELKSVLDSTPTFMGMSIPPAIKDVLKKEIEAGDFTQNNDNAATQIKARLFDLFGDKVIRKMERDWQVKVDAAYNRGVIGQQKRIHNIPPNPEEHPGHSSARHEGETGKLGNMANIDSDAKQVY